MKNEKMSCKERDAITAIVLKTGDRFYRDYKNKRIQTAWSLAGANLFGPWQIWEIEQAEDRLREKGYDFERVTVGMQ